MSLVIAVRLLWIAAHLFAIVSLESQAYRWRSYPFWSAYLRVSCVLACIYWPEYFPKLLTALSWLGCYGSWEDLYLPVLIAVLLLRTLAALEALHYQTDDFRWWGRLMLGAYGLGFAIVFAIHLVRDSHWAGSTVELRRYLQIWTGMVMLVVEWLFLSVGWWRKSRCQDWHALAVFALVLSHAFTSILSLTSHPIGQAWRKLDWIATLADAAVLVCWSLAQAQSQSIPSRAPRSTGTPLDRSPGAREAPTLPRATPRRS